MHARGVPAGRWIVAATVVVVVVSTVLPSSLTLSSQSFLPSCCLRCRCSRCTRRLYRDNRRYHRAAFVVTAVVSIVAFGLLPSSPPLSLHSSLPSCCSRLCGKWVVVGTFHWVSVHFYCCLQYSSFRFILFIRGLQ